MEEQSWESPSHRGALGIMMDHDHETLLGGGDPRRQDYVIGR